MLSTPTVSLLFISEWFRMTLRMKLRMTLRIKLRIKLRINLRMTLRMAIRMTLRMALRINLRMTLRSLLFHLFMSLFGHFIGSYNVEGMVHRLRDPSDKKRQTMFSSLCSGFVSWMLPVTSFACSRCLSVCSFLSSSFKALRPIRTKCQVRERAVNLEALDTWDALFSLLWFYFLEASSEFFFNV